MSPVRLIVVSPAAAGRGIAELWSGAELMGETVFARGRMEVRIDARPGGGPWVVDAASLTRALSDANRQFGVR